MSTPRPLQQPLDDCRDLSRPNTIKRRCIVEVVELGNEMALATAVKERRGMVVVSQWVMDMGSMETNKTVNCIGGEHWAYVFFFFQQQDFLFSFTSSFTSSSILSFAGTTPKYSPDIIYRAGYLSFQQAETRPRGGGTGTALTSFRQYSSYLI